MLSREEVQSSKGDGWMASAIPLVAAFAQDYPGQLEGVYYRVEGGCLEVFVVHCSPHFDYERFLAIARLEIGLTDSLQEFEDVQVHSIPESSLVPREVAAYQEGLEVFPIRGQ